MECEKLARALRRDRAPLPGPLSSFQRTAARRVAAHYGLAVEATPEDGGLALCRTGATRVPATRLQDVAGPARPSADDDAALGLGLAAGGAGPEAGPPRVVGVMRRSPSASGASDARAPAAPAAMSVEEREAAYERARERILGAATAEPPAGDSSYDAHTIREMFKEALPAANAARCARPLQPPPPRNTRSGATPPGSRIDAARCSSRVLAPPLQPLREVTDGPREQRCSASPGRSTTSRSADHHRRAPSHARPKHSSD